ncbi:hypothetical protein AB1M95_02005 [Sulfitobacter sp. LCG007]
MTSKSFIAGALPLVLAACDAATPLPETAHILAPATPGVVERQTGYANPIRNYTARPVTDPDDWRQSNSSQEGQ